MKTIWAFRMICAVGVLLFAAAPAWAQRHIGRKVAAAPVLEAGAKPAGSTASVVPAGRRGADDVVMARLVLTLRETRKLETFPLFAADEIGMLSAPRPGRTRVHIGGEEPKPVSPGSYLANTKPVQPVVAAISPAGSH